MARINSKSALKFTVVELAKERPKSSAGGHQSDRKKLQLDKKKYTRLKFTVTELAKERQAVGEGVVEASNNKSKEPRSFVKKEKFLIGRKILNKLGNKVSDEISDFVKRTDDNTVQAADKYRRGIHTGMKLGNRVRRYRKRTVDKRLAKHENKKKAKAAMREFKVNKHMERYGELPKGEHKHQVRSQKRKLKQKQIRSLCEKAFGPKKTDIAIKIMSAIVHGARRLAVWLLSFVGWPVVGIVAVAVVFIIGVSMLSSVVSGAVTTIAAYTSTNADIEAATTLATKLEAELEQKIARIPSQWRWGHIDEFRYNLDVIEHDPWQLMAYLSVAHPGFDMGLLSPVPTTIEQLHGSRYTLELDEERETRYREYTYTDPVTGEETTETVEYTYYILNVRLRSRSIEQVVWQQLQSSPDGDLTEWYQLLMETGGARQEIANPFDTDWRGQQSSLYGYRIDPVGGVNLQVHRGLDIPMPLGTPINAGLTGTVLYVGSNSMLGSYIILQDAAGTTVQYAHCDRVLLVAGQAVVAGETTIATVGNTGRSSGSHLHIEIKQDGQYINPIYAVKYEGAE